MCLSACVSPHQTALPFHSADTDPEPPTGAPAILHFVADGEQGTCLCCQVVWIHYGVPRGPYPKGESAGDKMIDKMPMDIVKQGGGTEPLDWSGDTA